MEQNAELINHENINEESNLKSPPKTINLNDSINKLELLPDIPLQNVNINIESLNNLNSQQNISKISKATQYKIYLPIVTIKIILPSFFMLKYIIYSFEDIEDQNYCKYSIIILALFILFCYYLAVFSNSSQTKIDKYFNDICYFFHKTDSPGNEIQDLNKYQWKDCPFCRSKKFMRTSHCRICNKCVLMRDHHCPYIANCVGFKNIQYFFNFVFWGDTGIIFYIISFIYFKFYSNIKLDIPIYILVFMYIDIILSGFFILNITGIMIRLILVVYNNRTQKENNTGPLTENYCPIFYCCTNFPKYQFKREINNYNQGFLSNFYHLVGPTILHFIFPLPKYKNYSLDENCPSLKFICHPDRLSLFKYMVENDESKMNLLEEGDSSPDFYIQNCHKYYDGKEII